MIKPAKRVALLYTLAFLVGMSHAEAGQAIDLSRWLPGMIWAWLCRKMKAWKPKSTRSSE